MKWQEKTLGSVCLKTTSGGTPASNNQSFYGGDIPWLRTQEVTFNYITDTEIKITESGLKNSSAKWIPEKSVIVALYGNSSGRVAINQIPLTTNQACGNFIIDPHKADYRFVYFRLLTDYEILHGMARGAAQNNLSLAMVKDYRIRFPNLPCQNRIGDILTTYDELIENNRRRMALLEESARLLYREWFVHLRFPGHATARVSEGIPEGWRKVGLGAICEAVRESVSPDEVEPDTPYIGLEHMPRRSISLGEWDTAEKVTSNKFRYREGDILFGKIRPYFHKVGIAFTDGIASSDAIVMRAKEEKHAALLLMTVSSDPFVADAAQSMREGSKMPRADWKQMTCYPVLLPPDGLLQQFSESIHATTDQLKTLTFQTQKLKTARDLLLPKLMSGEIEV